MKISIIAIGNSKGVRFSKAILQQYEITDAVELVLEKDHIIIKSVNKPRQGWEEKFETMHQDGEDQLLIDSVLEDEDFETWK